MSRPSDDLRSSALISSENPVPRSRAVSRRARAQHHDNRIPCTFAVDIHTHVVSFDRERQREDVVDWYSIQQPVCARVYENTRQRDKQREGEREGRRHFVCVRVCDRVGESERKRARAGMCRSHAHSGTHPCHPHTRAHTRAHTHTLSLTHLQLHRSLRSMPQCGIASQYVILVQLSLPNVYVLSHVHMGVNFAVLDTKFGCLPDTLLHLVARPVQT